MSLSKEMNESREKQRTHVLWDLPSVSFCKRRGKVVELSGMAVFSNWAWSSGDR